MTEILNSKRKLLEDTERSRTGPELWRLAQRKVKSYIKIKKIGGQTSTFLSGIDSELFTSETKSLGILFHPKRGFKAKWDVLLSFVLIYSCIISPYALAFSHTHICNYWCGFDLITDSILILDIFISFNTAVYDLDKTLITNHRDIIAHYFKTSFIFDLASALPYEVMNLDQSESPENLHLISIILRLFYSKKMYMIARLFRLFKLISNIKLCGLLKKLRDYLSITHNTMKLIRTLIKILVSVHIMACFWVIATKISDNKIDTWTIRYNPKAGGQENIYLLALYYSMTTLATVGYGDITPKTSIELILTIIWMFIAVYFLSFNISSLNSIISESDFKKNILMHKMALIEDYTKSQHISRFLRKKMKNEIKEKISRMKHSAEDQEEVISYLPIDIKYEIALTMHKNVINEFPFFKEKEAIFVANIFPKLYSKFMSPGEIVYTQSQNSEEVFFIANGGINFIYDKENLPFRSISKGQYFGDYEAIHEKRRSFGAISRLHNHLLVMSSDLLNTFRRDFPSVWFDFRQVADYRHHMNIKALAEMIVITRINKEGKLSKISNEDLQKLIKVQLGVLNFKCSQVNYEELRKKSLLSLKSEIYEQREVLFRVVNVLKRMRNFKKN
ncbi:hypothetical protein SteCoe_35024 [Stentor coeruleus]|uniref:Cyclic nucleotide-binding domain-containing protein n=1 Tax=Stentor coeruleus TaxID=5963 RepID=A0A1R2AT86_9CILI|nr:hypothetical protein SteCoe_35024 [Stentor coeruleus]